MTPFRSEKNTNWEGAYRLPCVIRWPGKIKPGTVSNEMVAHHDWLPTFLAMAGDPDIKDKLSKGHTIGDLTYKVHLDGFNLVPYLSGETEKGPREWFLYCNDDQQLVALRYDNWKLVFSEQRSPGTLELWAEPFTTLRVPKIFNLRTDPFERADITSNTYYDWLISHVYMLVPAQAFVGEFLQTFQSFRSAKRPPASTSTKCSAKCRRAPTARAATRGRRAAVRVYRRPPTRREAACGSDGWRNGCASSAETLSSSSMRWRWSLS